MDISIFEHLIAISYLGPTFFAKKAKKLMWELAIPLPLIVNPCNFFTYGSFLKIQKDLYSRDVKLSNGPVEKK